MPSGSKPSGRDSTPKRTAGAPQYTGGLGAGDGVAVRPSGPPGPEVRQREVGAAYRTELAREMTSLGFAVRRGTGRGGRNVEYLLAEAIAANGRPGIWGLAADTDGVDGAEDIAGAIFTPDTLARARDVGRDPQAMLDDNDGHGFFERLGDSLVTGPTRTNVNDFRATLIAP